jgi:hypothetical protein
MNDPSPNAQQNANDSEKTIAEAKRELMFLKYLNHPHIGPAHIYELTVVLRLQELEDELDQKTLCLDTPTTTTRTSSA